MNLIEDLAADLVDSIASSVAMRQYGIVAQLPDGTMIEMMEMEGLKRTLNAARSSSEQICATLNACWAISTLNWRYH